MIFGDSSSRKSTESNKEALQISGKRDTINSTPPTYFVISDPYKPIDWTQNSFKTSPYPKSTMEPERNLKEVLIYDFGFEATSSNHSVFHDSDFIDSFDSKLMEPSRALVRSLGTDCAISFARQERRAGFHMAWNCFAFALTGELIIVVPMLMLIVGHATTKALGAALFAKTDPTNLLTVMAVYPAVLVVLIAIEAPVASPH
ncbi:hypothetical protein COCMIDRAFT_7204 [Bipolaris oryzae ATCC 44560]|uniref:Uncharacterized protein n=1 Tax=Bipolaris oryzae ATCC 44560 TaxID=930090 RepID=W6YV60_COCMI|nr:uncharacterized protein COCMIDRAFT_7204 [Bipolaris oryzae ATCC 44560]EUC43332.1 hypothetical protein COCMIDRAFT_7204 [Bipolaris oryzae ATCC 44560]